MNTQKERAPEPLEPQRPRNVIKHQDTPDAQEAARDRLARRLEEGRALSDHFTLARSLSDDRPFGVRCNGLALLHRQTGLAVVMTITNIGEWRAPLAAWQVLVNRLEMIGGPSGLWDLEDMGALSQVQQDALDNSENAVKEWLAKYQPTP